MFIIDFPFDADMMPPYMPIGRFAVSISMRSNGRSDVLAALKISGSIVPIDGVENTNNNDLIIAT